MRVIRSIVAVAVGAALVAGGAAGAEVARTHRATSPTTLRAVAASGSVKAAGRPSTISASRYVPIAPCRVFDSRKAAAGILQPGATRTVRVAGTTGFEAQGGTAGGCGIPSYATAVQASFTSTQAEGGGYLRAWASGAAAANATILNWTNLGRGGITASSTIPIASSMVVEGFASRTHLVVDVVGYHVESMSAYVTSGGTLSARNGPISSASRLSTGYYQVTLAEAAVRCTPLVAVQGSSLYYGVATSPSNKTVFVTLSNLGASGAAVDADFTITVEC